MSSNLRATFEKEIKDKLIQKSSTFQSEEGVLIKCFRFFDLDNSGEVDFNEFTKAIEKIGVQTIKPAQLRELFDYYDTNKNGVIDYKEFSAAVFGNASPATKRFTPEITKFKNTNAEQLLDRVRDALHKRGPGGIVGLGKQFTISDRNHNRALDRDEFVIAMRNFGTGINDTESGLLFDYFDSDRSGTIQYDEFVYALAGEMNNFRRKLVEQAFNKLDKDHNGELTIDDLRGVYNAKNHPDVKAGKKSEDQVLQEFLKTFETVYDYQRIDDDRVTKDEFMHYYNFISASIDSDKFFEALINNSWRLNEGTRKTTEKAWSSQYEAPNKAATGGPPDRIVNPTRTGGDYEYRREPEQSYKSAAGERYKKSAPKPDPQVAESALNKVREKLAGRGVRGFISIQRHFRIMDDDNDKEINYNEFSKALKELKLILSDQEAKALFNDFDTDGSGKISIDEFLRGVRGEMNSFRKNLVQQAFKVLDRDGDGVLRVNDIKSIYSAKNHPDVRSGRKSEIDVLGEFLETFEAHHNALKKGTRDQNVTLEEFMEYYNNVGANIDDDKQFENMIVTGYKLGSTNQAYQEYNPSYAGKAAWGQSYKGESKGGARPGTSGGAPYGTTDVATDYSTTYRPQTAQSRAEQPKKSYAAGGYQSERRESQQQARDDEGLITALRDKVASRGTRGILGMARLFRIIDDDNSRSLSFPEFSKCLNDLRLDFKPDEVKRLFAQFDSDRSGSIDYDEFLRMIRGPLNATRAKIVKEAFKKLDADGSGVITIEDVRGRYNCKNHPDVKSGKKTEDEILVDFLDTFEQHHAVHTGDFKGRNAQVTLDEFMEYYNNISSSIDDDRYFETMIRNAWNLDNRNYQKGGWASKY